MTHLMILYLHIHTQSCKHLFSYTEQVKLGIFLSFPQIIKLRFFCIFLDVEKKIQIIWDPKVSQNFSFLYMQFL